MGDRFQNLGFTAKYSPNAFNFSGNFVPFGATVGSEPRADTILRLTSAGSSSIPSESSPKGTKRKWISINSHISPRVGSSLSLGPLGRSSSSSDSKGSSATACTTVSSAKETDEGSSMDLGLDFSLHLGGEKLISPNNVKTHEVDLELSLSTGPSESEITSLHPFREIAMSVLVASDPDEGSTSRLLKKHSFARRESFQLNEPPQKFVHDFSSSVISTPKSSVTTTTTTTTTCTSGLSHHRHVSAGNSKTCQIEGCGKGARGASGRCISHGGGRRCQRQGCHKGAEGRTVYCKAHGGGRRCEFLGCTKSAEGRTDFCIAHGGGRRCSHDGCTRAARGKSGLCIRHGGGKRCQREGCTKSAEGLSGLCISHGGGRRCQREGCTKGAQGSTMFCKAHGGGKRCTAEGCTKGAEGSTPFCKGHGGGKRCAFRGGEACSKSVHGGTNYCVAHGGGKRCAVLECTKSARGRTDFCVRHGGGKRCKSDGCGKSAQGSTDFCKAHGGGKRCSWENGDCTSFARGKTGLCALHGGLVADKRVHGGVTLGPMVVQEPEKPETTAFASSSSSFSAEDMAVDGGAGFFDVKRYGESSNASAAVVIGEGRVHGGSNFVMNWM